MQRFQFHSVFFSHEKTCLLQARIRIPIPRWDFTTVLVSKSISQDLNCFSSAARYFLARPNHKIKYVLVGSSVILSSIAFNCLLPGVGPHQGNLIVAECLSTSLRFIIFSYKNLFCAWRRRESVVRIQWMNGKQVFSCIMLRFQFKLLQMWNMNNK